MAERIEEKSRFKIAVEAPKEAGGALVFTFAPEKVHPERTAKGVKRRPPQYSVVVTGIGEMMSFDWSDSPDDPGELREHLETEISERLRKRDLWFDRVCGLIDEVDLWAGELGWITRRIEKKPNDTYMGRHRTDSLRMQKEDCWIMLEPMGRSNPEEEPVVDLYLMPSYDDMASLYFHDNAWHFHYMFSGTQDIGSLREADGMALTKGSLHKVLSEMRQNAETDRLDCSDKKSE